MQIHFSKMHGTGNDYVYVDCTRQTIPDPGSFSEFVSDRHFGIGSDGLILILPSAKADFMMRIFNADASEGMMCGNGIRCVGKYVYDHGMTDKTEISVDTLSGVKHLKLFVEDGKVARVTVDMGKAVLKPSGIPVAAEGDEFVARPVEVDGESYPVTCVGMGNPHAVIFRDDVAGMKLEGIGPKFETHALFPNRVNTEFVRVIDEKTIEMRVWERGSGETFACGTGACASVVACVLNGKCRKDEDVTVHLRGGDLSIRYQTDGTVLMTGPATHVFDGVIDYDFREASHGKAE